MMATYTGTVGNDTLSGSTAADTLVGLNGNDVYRVNALGDVIVESSTAGSGTDTIITSVLDALGTYSLGWSANVEDLTYAGTLAAILQGNALNNVIRANAGAATNDTLQGGAGNDSLYGYGGNDSIVGGAGNDLLDGGLGGDFMIGGAGNDSYWLDSGADRVFEYSAGGFDTIVSTTVKDLRVSWAGQVEALRYTGSVAATLHGNALGNQIVSIAATADVLWGYAGNDTLDGGGGIDTLRGGAGNDTYLVTADDVVVELASEGIDTLVGTRTDISGTAYSTTIENLFYTGATGATIMGNPLANLVSGGAGNDKVSGGDGDDTLLGGAGADSLQGGAGNDVLYGASNPDRNWVPNRTLIADVSIDTLVGGAGNDRYLINDQRDLIVELADGGTRDIVVSTVDSTLSRHANVEALLLQANTSAWYGQGSAGSNVIVGNERDNYLVGGDGNDTLAGNGVVTSGSTPQGDVVEGGAGNDALIVFDFGQAPPTAREASLFGGSGNDLYVLGAALGTVGGFDSAGLDTAVLISSGSLDQLEGVENIYLWGANSSIDGTARIAIDAAYAVATGASAYAGAIGGALNATGNDLGNGIFGNAASNALAGGGGNDTIVAGAGNDTLDGGAGIDSLVGGAGNDWYYLDTGDVAVELAGGGFDVLVSYSISTSAGFGAYANFEGWQYLGSAGVSLNRGTTNTSNDLLIGGSGNDTLGGFGGNDTLRGGVGADSVSGGVGQDSLAGDAGNDTLDGGADSDTLDGGDGNDLLLGQLGDDRLLGGGGDDTLDGGGNWDHLEGGAGADIANGGDGNDFIAGGEGNDALNGQGQVDVLVGGGGADTLSGGGAQGMGVIGSAHGDHLWGDEQFGSGGGHADRFLFDTVAVENGITETFSGSGVWEFINGATIGDYEAGLDRILVAKEFVGDLDSVLDAAAESAGAGDSFSAAAEIVFFRADVADTFAVSQAAFFDDIDAGVIDSVIGDADAAMALNTGKLFITDDGTNSAIFLFYSVDGDQRVSLDELYLLGVVTGQSSLTTADFLLA